MRTLQPSLDPEQLWSSEHASFEDGAVSDRPPDREPKALGVGGSRAEADRQRPGLRASGEVDRAAVNLAVLDEVDAVVGGLIFYDFTLDHPSALDPQVTSNAVGQEGDWYMDWSVNDHFIVSVIAAAADPGAAIQQLSGRDDTLIFGMIFAAYSF